MVRHMFTLRGLDGFDHFLIGLKRQSHLDFIFSCKQERYIVFICFDDLLSINEQMSIYYTNSVCSRSKVNNIVMHVHL